jgi:RES domain-containing protein
VTILQGWRLARAAYADLSGEGARRYGGRWNSPGRSAVYLSEDAALPVLEVLVHLDLPPELIPDDYVLMRVDLTPLAEDGGQWVEDGPADRLDTTHSRATGDAWLDSGRTPVLRVPSVIVPESRNLLLNPEHPLAARIIPPVVRPFAFDPRLLGHGG